MNIASSFLCFGWKIVNGETNWSGTFTLDDGPADLLMASYSRKGASRYFVKEDTRKRIHGGGSIVLYATMDHENFLENHMQFLVNTVGPVTDACQEHNEEVIVAHQTSNKRPSPSESSSSHEGRCWKKVKPSSDEPRDTNLHIVQISDNNGSSSRTLNFLKRGEEEGEGVKSSYEALPRKGLKRLSLKS
ncbi:hypothetical protein HAX54_049447 [Datura stramonium]|uniref:Uncharacterized protein n=1 Tax=Datura stramonium TaxID=4076 RepID=A0ABS8WPB1_DATST|nr:hypothetical protein [Datura stramonium]